MSYSSSSKAEYMTIAEAIKKKIEMTDYLEELGKQNDNILYRVWYNW